MAGLQRRTLERLKALTPYMSELSERSRAILKMRVDGLTLDQVAAKLGMTDGGVGASMTNSIARLEAARAREDQLDNDQATIVALDRLRVARTPANDSAGYPDRKPATRGECETMPRPCPFFSCRHHLGITVNPLTGHISESHPGADVDELPGTCSLDVAAEGGVTLDAVGHLIGVVRERVRQVEVMGLQRVRATAPGLLMYAPDAHDASGGRRTLPAAGMP